MNTARSFGQHFSEQDKDKLEIELHALIKSCMDRLMSLKSTLPTIADSLLLDHTVLHSPRKYQQLSDHYSAIIYILEYKLMTFSEQLKKLQEKRIASRKQKSIRIRYKPDDSKNSDKFEPEEIRALQPQQAQILEQENKELLKFLLDSDDQLA